MIDIVERLEFDAMRCDRQYSKGVASNIRAGIYEIRQLRKYLSDANSQLAALSLCEPGFLDRMIRERDEARSQLGKAQAALAPFAAVAAPETCKDKLSVLGIDRLIGVLTVGHLRAARAALADDIGAKA